jgi:hypothetical protein
MVLNATDNCDYSSTGTGDRDRNWAIDWQTNHVLGVDWFDMVAAHSQPLNGNLKAYSAWWLWARLAGWPGPAPVLQIQLESLGSPTLTYIRPTGVPTNSYFLQYSHNFSLWSDVLPQMIASQSETVTNGGVQVRTRLIGTAPAGTFFRVNVSGN